MQLIKNKVILTACVMSALYCHAQNEISTARFEKLSDSTAFGLPDGTPIVKQIGAEGGRIVSGDGKVELIFAPGALTTNTAISIQPVTNIAPNGAGKTYLFQPSGIQFKKPVQIIFHYTDEDAETCPPDLMALAMQDDKGRWSFFDYEDLDSTTKTMRGLIHHFSYYTKINKVMIRPEKREIGVNDTTAIDVLDLGKIDHDSGHFQGDYQVAILKAADSLVWYANGVENGNELVGKIYPAGFKTAPMRLAWAVYKAPQYLPVENTVTIKLNIRYYSRRAKKQLTSAISTTISIYDAYRIRLATAIEVKAAAGNEIVDSASFHLWIYPQGPRMEDIRNSPPVLTKQSSRLPNWKLNIITDGAAGLIHVTPSIKNFRLIRNEKGPPEVYFELATPEVLVLKLYWESKRPRFTTDTEPWYQNSLPGEINFMANGEEQRFSINASGISYSLIVQPYRK